RQAPPRASLTPGPRARSPPHEIEVLRRDRGSERSISTRNLDLDGGAWRRRDACEPPTALGAGADRHMLLTRANVLVRVGVAQPWFGRAGGGLRAAGCGLRMTLADDFVGIRDLVAQGVLE